MVEIQALQYGLQLCISLGNVAADYLAKFGCNLLDFTEIVETSLPNILRGLVRLDHSGLPFNLLQPSSHINRERSPKDPQSSRPFQPTKNRENPKRKGHGSTSKLVSQIPKRSPKATPKLPPKSNNNSREKTKGKATAGSRTEQPNSPKAGHIQNGQKSEKTPRKKLQHTQESCCRNRIDSALSESEISLKWPWGLIHDSITYAMLLSLCGLPFCSGLDPFNTEILLFRAVVGSRSLLSTFYPIHTGFTSNLARCNLRLSASNLVSEPRLVYPSRRRPLPADRKLRRFDRNQPRELDRCKGNFLPFVSFADIRPCSSADFRPSSSVADRLRLLRQRSFLPTRKLQHFDRSNYGSSLVPRVTFSHSPLLQPNPANPSTPGFASFVAADARLRLRRSLPDETEVTTFCDREERREPATMKVTSPFTCFFGSVP
ncbi:hypothetical protein M5K25_001857 [Dendrobium thyrsiflorum]|uniref:Uncharacterized protein n=1 Tax=Dendrobium thyrsiflorum TaxID=117978 RepID=A0ABD0VRX7_DENTH